MLLKHAVMGSNPPVQYIDSLFSSFTYTGNGSTQTIVNGIDLAGKGGMVWIKARALGGAGGNHATYNTTRAAKKFIGSNLTDAQVYVGGADDTLTSFNANGFSLGADAIYTRVNYNATTYASWTFRNAPKFFKETVVTKSSGSNATVDLSTLGTVGMVKVKRTDAAGSWYVWHRSLSAGKLLIGETTAAEATLGHITVSGTTLTLVNGVIADGTYHVEAYAHDTGPDGLIQCGSYVGNGSATGPIVTLGWEPQYLFIKGGTSATGSQIIDNMRGFDLSDTKRLLAHDSGAELSGTKFVAPSATGIQIVDSNANFNTNGATYIYLAIRRPNKPPTSGTQVYSAIARVGTGTATTITGVGFAPDLVMPRGRVVSLSSVIHDRLRGSTRFLEASSAAAEATTYADTITSFGMDGVVFGADASYWSVNQSPNPYINHFFRRAPGFMDSSCDAGTGVAKTEAHSLGVVPELMIRKGRSGATQWEVYFAALGNTQKMILNSTAAAATDTTAWNSTTPTASVFTVGTGANVNTNAATYVTYHAASLAGVSKIGTYTGNGTTQTINCGFAAGARFILIKSSSATGAWTAIDAVRGIVAGSDPYLLLNSTAAEVTNEDCVDPDSSGFIVNTTTAALNTNGVTYQYWAIA